MAFLSAEYSRYIGSAAWAKKRQACFSFWKWECAVCGPDWRERGDHLECHHLHYRTLGHENVRYDLRPLCSLHHGRGRITHWQLKMRRKSYRSRKRWAAVFRFVWRLLLFIVKLTFRTSPRPGVESGSVQARKGV
jgi:hypothetical protein